MPRTHRLGRVVASTTVTLVCLGGLTAFAPPASAVAPSLGTVTAWGSNNAAQNAVSKELEDAAMMATDEWHQDLPATGRQHGHRRRLVLLHEAAESNHVSGKDGG